MPPGRVPQDDEFEEASLSAEHWEPEKILRWAFSTYQQQVEIASAFGAEGVVLIDIAARTCPGLPIFLLDTQLLFPETYELAARIEQKYDLKVERIRPALSPEQQAVFHGTALWKRDPDRCCGLRKIEPLEWKLRQLKAWITSIRRNQTAARATARKLEWNTRFGLVKINPLADWTNEMVWSYIRKNDVPYNPLHDCDYPSLGCVHCTRPVTQNEDRRAGRWAGFHKTECGLHEPDPAPLRPSASPEAPQERCVSRDASPAKLK